MNLLTLLHCLTTTGLEVKLKTEESNGSSFAQRIQKQDVAGREWVKSVKRVLRKILKTVQPREETLRSFLLEAANIVNSRPLAHVPVRCNDEEPLTPNHFLLGEESGIQGPGPTEDKIWSLRKQWRIVQNLKNHFWSRWISEYLPSLTVASG